MGKPRKIRSRLVTYTVRAIDPDTDKSVTWEISLQGNRIREDRADWLKDARKYYRDISLTRKQDSTNSTSAHKESKADIAREGLKLLDQLIAARTA